MSYRQRYVFARGVSKRPLCQHVRHPAHGARTLCGRELTGWARSYTDKPVPVLLCYRCAWLEEQGARSARGRVRPSR